MPDSNIEFRELMKAFTKLFIDEIGDVKGEVSEVKNRVSSIEKTLKQNEVAAEGRDKNRVSMRANHYVIAASIIGAIMGPLITVWLIKMAGK